MLPHIVMAPESVNPEGKAVTMSMNTHVLLPWLGKVWELSGI
jgi:hypothetical protein